MLLITAVPDPDLEIREGGGGGGNPHPEISKGGGEVRSPKNFFPPVDPQFGLKIRGGRVPRGPSPGSITVTGLGQGNARQSIQLV